ncbi:hypothetical protein L6452_19321 [Arctium lappa]|uniref:Uncharacterized protein n=1 Tax=Arctium lappa TaxID=4217 RepID=A0ACB9B944_ARCLA|nr:hypothetical protein L6452_19321 [Arctium lappa]
MDSACASRRTRLLLTDSQGTNTTTVIYATQFRFFLKTYKPYKRYYISNVVVTKADPRFLVSMYPHSWTLNSRTLLEEHIEQIPPVLPCTFQFTPFAELAKHAEMESHQSDRCQMLPKKRPIILTLWNHFADNEGQILENLIDPPAMIFGLRLKVSSFNGLSLTTRNGSGILINPPVSEDLQLNNRYIPTDDRYHENRSEIEKLLDQKAFRNMDALLPPPKQIDIIPIATYLANLKTQKTS